ncbi:MAG: prepilin peptidase [Defluviitaleaceae bacterium]|nr:prepilin peptidase [Defluviitaleaceae bacterium]
MPDIVQIAFMVIAFLTGLCFGSFANVIIYRVPKKLSIIDPPSHCPYCNKRLGVLELFPIFSWLFLFGKCRSCKKKISPRYLFVELVCGLLFVSAVHFSATYTAFPVAFLMFILLAITFIDIDIQEIPDGLVFAGAVAGVVWVAGGHFFPELFPLAQTWQNALLGVVAGGLPLLVFDRLSLLILKKDGFGYGDVKLMAMVGLFIGWELMLLAYFFAFLSGAAFAVYLIASGKSKRGSYMAFGPFLCVGTLAAFWFGEAVLGWYLGVLFGG